MTFGQLQATFQNLQSGLQFVTNLLNNLTEESNSFAKAMKTANTMAGKDAAGFKELKGQVASWPPLSHQWLSKKSQMSLEAAVMLPPDIARQTTQKKLYGLLLSCPICHAECPSTPAVFADTVRLLNRIHASVPQDATGATRCGTPHDDLYER